MAVCFYLIKAMVRFQHNYYAELRNKSILDVTLVYTMSLDHTFNTVNITNWMQYMVLPAFFFYDMDTECFDIFMRRFFTEKK